MAGSIFGLGLSQRVKSTGKPEAGWRLYLYQAGTNTPVIAYKDTGLTAGQEHPFPIAADNSGMMPAFWLADGTYRVRATSKTGASTFFDMPSVLALGASSGSGGGGGGEVDSSIVFGTGDLLWQDVSGTRPGWVRDNGRSIGSASSGASERANADCEALFAWLYGEFSDTLCPVSTGRGASASADWAANKTITLPDKRGRSPFGLDDMGNLAASRLTGVTFSTGNATTAGSLGGEAMHTLLTAELPTITPAGTVASISKVVTSGTDPLAKETTNDGAGASHSVPDANQLIVRTATQAFTGTPFGSGTAHNNMPNFVLGTFYRKL